MPPARPKPQLEEEDKAVVKSLIDAFTALKKKPRLPQLAGVGASTEQDCYLEVVASGKTLGDHLADTVIVAINELREHQGCSSRISGKESLIVAVFYKRFIKESRCGWDDPIGFARLASELGVDASAPSHLLREPSFRPQSVPPSVPATRPTSPFLGAPPVVEAFEAEAEPSVTRSRQQEAAAAAVVQRQLEVSAAAFGESADGCSAFGALLAPPALAAERQEEAPEAEAPVETAAEAVGTVADEVMPEVMEAEPAVVVPARPRRSNAVTTERMLDSRNGLLMR